MKQKKITQKKSKVISRPNQNISKSILYFGILVVGVFLAVSLSGQHQSLKEYASGFFVPVTSAASKTSGAATTVSSKCSTNLSSRDLNHVNSVVQGVMNKDSLPGLSIAISKKGQLVFAKGYGVSNKSSYSPVTTSTQFRVASVTKPFTSTGILRLVEAGKISLDQKVFGPGSILGTTYTANPMDPRINDITVRQLLTQTSGMWTNDNNDPMFGNISMTQSQLITYTLENRMLTTAPGSTYAYSNFGYLILGRIIEKVTGQTYEAWMKANVMAPAGITSMQIAGSTLAERAANEAVYYNSSYSPYGFNIRRMDSHGGWIANPVDIVRFLVRMDGSATSPADLLTPADLSLVRTATAQSITANAPYGMGWMLVPSNGAVWHNGSVPGTASIAVIQGDFTWVAVTNANNSSTTGIDIDNMMWQATNGVTSWSSCATL